MSSTLFMFNLPVIKYILVAYFAMKIFAVFKK